MSAKRFRIAFSFAGEKRNFVAQVAAILASSFGEDRILYDKYHEAEFARPRLGRYLPKLYHEQADLVVVVLCEDYSQKEWPGLEWDAIFDLLKKRKEAEVMLCRFDHATVEGLFSDAGYVGLDDKSPEQTAKLILKRLELNEAKLRDHSTAEVVTPTFPPVLTADNKENPPMPNKPEDNKPFISQHIGDNSPNAKNTIGDVNYFAASPDRHLTAEQQSMLITFLSTHSKGAIRITCVASNQEARQFAQELATVLRTSGWQVEGPLDSITFFAPDAGPIPGLFLGLHSREAVPARANVLQQALGWKGIDFPAPCIVDPGLADDGVSLFINARP